MKKYIFNLL